MPTSARAEWRGPSGAALAAPAAPRVTLAWLLRLGMCLSFVTAFLQYETSVGIAQYLSLLFFGCCGLLVLCGRRRTDRVQHILSGGGLWFAAVVFGEVVSYTSHDSYSEAYGILFIGVFLCARLVVQEIGIPNLTACLFCRRELSLPLWF